MVSANSQLFTFELGNASNDTQKNSKTERQKDIQAETKTYRKT